MKIKPIQNMTALQFFASKLKFAFLLVGLTAATILNASVLNNGKEILTGKDYLKKIKANYEGIESLEIQMQYKLYKGYVSNQLFQSYNSIYYKDGASTYRKIDQTEIIGNEKMTVKINHSEKAIMLSSPMPASAFDADLEGTIAFCSDILVARGAKETTISMLIKAKTDLPYGRVDIKIDNNFWIKEMTLYYSQLLDFSESYQQKDMAYPRLVISYDVFNNKWKDKEGLVDLSNYVIENNKKISPAAKLGNYEILDYRINR